MLLCSAYTAALRKDFSKYAVVYWLDAAEPEDPWEYAECADGVMMAALQEVTPIVGQRPIVFSLCLC